MSILGCSPSGIGFQILLIMKTQSSKAEHSSDELGICRPVHEFLGCELLENICPEAWLQHHSSYFATQDKNQDNGHCHPVVR